MDTNQIMSAIFLIAVLILILPNFLSTNNKLKEFLKNSCKFLLVDKKAGKTKAKTAIKKITDIT